LQETYESIFISPVELATNKLDDYVEKIKSLITKAGGEVLAVEKWGRRRLAYPIRRHREGFYVFVKFKSPSGVLAELNRFYRVSEEIIRELTVKAVRVRPGRFGPMPTGAPGGQTPSAVSAAAPAAAAVEAGASSAPKEVPHA
jgi:small subunit ribosomal protein S6